MNPRSTDSEADALTAKPPRRFHVLVYIVSECPSDIFTRDDNYFLLSNNVATFIEAENSCKSSGGSIVQISNSSRSLLFHRLINKYIPGKI